MELFKAILKINFTNILIILLDFKVIKNRN